MAAASKIEQLEERLERLDARRREAAGQMGLDLTGGGKGAGSGLQCGAGWIDPNKTCHKAAGGGQPAAAPAKKPAASAGPGERPTLAGAVASHIAAGLAARDGLIKELKRYGIDLSKEEQEELLTGDLADMLEAQQMIAAQKARQAASSSVLTNPGRQDPGLAPKAKPQGINAQDVVTGKQQAQLARQQQAAAKAAGDERGARAWRQEERKVERNRLAAAITGGQQSQSSLFGVTEYDETMPLFRARRDHVDPVAQLLGVIIGEQLPGAQVLDWATHPRGVTAGRMVADGLVYRFRCDSESVGYQPGWDGINERQWEQRSEGFLAAREPGARLDFKGVKFQQQRTKRKCTVGYSCGASCISMNKECRVTPSSAISKARLRALQTLAKEGNTLAAETLLGVQQQRSQKASSLREGRQVDQLKKLLQDPRVAEMIRTGRLPEAQAGPPKPGDVRNVTPGGIEVDAERFQYKLNSSATGEVGSLSGVKKWDPNLAGVVSVWLDPQDGKTYVVNGHNRLALARRLGAEEITVRYLDAANAKEARAIGAMQNIAEGAGKETDAAKFFRDTGITSMEEVQARGLPLQSGKAQRGLALAQLPEEMFQDVIQGNLRVRQAAVIGGSGLDQDKQREVYKVLKERPSMTDGRLGEYVEHLAVSQRQTQTEIDLFGSSKKSVDTGLARAELSDTLKNSLKREARLLGAVSKNAAAVELLEKRGGNVINVVKSQQEAEEASSVLRVFNQLKFGGGVGSALDRAAARLTNGENKAKVQRELRAQVIEAMEEELRQLGLRKEPPKNEAPTASLFDSAAARLDAIEARADAVAGGRGGKPCGGATARGDRVDSAIQRLVALCARLDSEGVRFQQQRTKRKCTVGYSCGASCISINKECRVTPSSAISKARLRALQTLAKEGNTLAAEKLAAPSKAAAVSTPAPKPAAASETQALAVAAGGEVVKALAKTAPAASSKGVNSPPRELTGKYQKKKKNGDIMVGGQVELDEPVEVKRKGAKKANKVNSLAIEVLSWTESVGNLTAEKLTMMGLSDIPEKGLTSRALAFETGPSRRELGFDQMTLPPAAGKRVSFAIFREMEELIKGFPDGQLVSCHAWANDGLGAKRQKIYERYGFSPPVYEMGPMYAVVMGGKLQRIGRPRNDARFDAGQAIDLESLVYELVTLGPDATEDGMSEGNDQATADRLVDVLERLEQRLEQMEAREVRANA